MKVVFSAQAKAELREIALYIARDNKSRAQSFVRELRQKARDLGGNPLAFPIVPRVAHLGIRRRVYGNYLILYRIAGDVVSIIHIMHGARDYEAIFLAEG